MFIYWMMSVRWCLDGGEATLSATVLEFVLSCDSDLSYAARTYSEKMERIFAAETEFLNAAGISET